MSYHTFRHMCMTMRGVEKEGAKTTTSCMLGELRENPMSRQEFLWRDFTSSPQHILSHYILD